MSSHSSSWQTQIWIKLDVIETRKRTYWMGTSFSDCRTAQWKINSVPWSKGPKQGHKKQHYKLPATEELFAEITGARYFSKLEASNGYRQTKIDTEWSKLLTFATPFERFCFKPLPYGILSAGEIFQTDISEIIESLEGARNSQYDIIVWEETLAEHSSRVSKVMRKIRESGLKLNKSKCVFGAQCIKFLGLKLSSARISPDPENVKVISDMPKPTSKTDLQRFLGMVVYLPKFTPNLLNKTKEFCELILKEIVWDFGELHERKFDEFKSTISNCVSWKFFDSKLQNKLHVTPQNLV